MGALQAMRELVELVDAVSEVARDLRDLHDAGELDAAYIGIGIAAMLLCMWCAGSGSNRRVPGSGPFDLGGRYTRPDSATFAAHDGPR